MITAIGIVGTVLSVGWFLLVMTANMMSDNPSEQFAMWPAGAAAVGFIALVGWGLFS